MSSAADIYELDAESTHKLLSRLQGWRSGICPDGTLAKEACFVLAHRPSITIHPDQSFINSPLQQQQTTEIITERDWSQNLVDCGAITHLQDDLMIKTMSDFYMIFHSLEQVNNCNTLHSLQLRKHASFKVDNILRPTRQLHAKIQELLVQIEEDRKWDKLLDIWNTFGYLWPRKIILGYKTYSKSTYKFVDGVDSMNGFYYHLGKLKDKYHHEVLQKDLAATSFDLFGFLNNATVVARQDMAPMHEFLDLETKTAIHEIIHAKFVQIPVHYPIKIYNVSTNSYLCWDPYGHSQEDPSFDGEVHDYLVRAVSAEPSELNKSPESQYLWRFTWTPIAAAATTQFDGCGDTPPTTNNTIITTSFNPAEHRSQTLRGCNNVYIYPACKSISPKSNSKKSTPKSSNSQAWRINDRQVDGSFMDTHEMVLSCRPYRYEEKSMQAPEFSKLRALRLLASESPQYLNEKIDWTINYPNNELKYMTDAQANIKLNFHEHVRRMKPLLDGDMIQLQQIGLLTAFNPIKKASPHEEIVVEQRPKHSEQQQLSSSQSLRTTKRISAVARKPSLKSKNKKNVLCVDEDITVESWRENTFWKIELANAFDMTKHSSNFVRWPLQQHSTNDYGYPSDYPLLSQG
jgi:hypothetical protein